MSRTITHSFNIPRNELSRYWGGMAWPAGMADRLENQGFEFKEDPIGDRKLRGKVKISTDTVNATITVTQTLKND